MHDLLVEEYSDEDDNMEVGNSKEAAGSEVPESMGRRVELFRKMLSNTIMAKDASIALKTTVPGEADETPSST